MPKQFDPKALSNYHIAKLKEYRVTSQECWKLADHSEIIKADWNESGCKPSPKVIDSLLRFIAGEPLQWYPDVEATALRHSLAKYAHLSFDQVQVFGGSDAALEYLCRAFLNPGEEVVLRLPTYDNFRVYAESCGATVIGITNDSPFHLDINPILDAITPQTKIVYLVNPDNPTGIVYKESELKLILEKAAHALVISDEAYFEFYGHSAALLLEEYPNLIVSRSFSKAFALAGLRIGYLLASPEIIAVINKIRVGKNVNSLAQLAALTALADEDYLKTYVKEVQANKIWLSKELTKLGFEIHCTEGNFFLIKVSNPSAYTSHLKNEGIYVRDRSYLPQMEGFVRISVGTKAQAERILGASASYLELQAMMAE